MDIADVMDRTADGIQKSSAAPGGIVPVGHRLNIPDVYPVVNYLAHIIEKDSRDKSFAVCFLLLLDHGVKTADGVCLKAAHGAAAVKDENDLCQILSHNQNLQIKTVTAWPSPYSHSIEKIVFGLVAWQATFRTYRGTVRSQFQLHRPTGF